MMFEALVEALFGGSDGLEDFSPPRAALEEPAGRGGQSTGGNGARGTRDTC